MFVIMHFHDHSMQKSLFLGVREGILIKLLIKATIPMGLRVVYALFGSLTSLKIIALVAPGILSTFFSIDLYRALKISLSHRDQNEVSSLKDFFTLSPISVITQRYFLSAIDVFVLTLAISFITRTFSPSARSFFTCHIARGIIKLIAWTTSFLEERLDFYIT